MTDKHDFDIEAFRAFGALARAQRTGRHDAPSVASLPAEIRLTMWVSDYVSSRVVKLAQKVVEKAGGIATAVGVDKVDHAAAHRIIDGGVIDGMLSALSRQVVNSVHGDPKEAWAAAAELAREFVQYVLEELKWREQQAQVLGALVRAAAATNEATKGDTPAPRVLQ